MIFDEQILYQQSKAKNKKFERSSLRYLQFVRLYAWEFHENHKHIHNVENNLHMDGSHLFPDNIHLINLGVYHIHSRVEFPH